MTISANTNYNYKDEWDSFVKSGDLHSFKTLYNFYFDLLYHYGKKYRAEYYLIEDSIQNVFLNLIKNNTDLYRVNNFHGYLLYSFRNELLKLLEKERRYNFYNKMPEFNFYIDNNPEDVLIKSEISTEVKRFLKDCIKTLTSSQQEILFLRYSLGLSYDDISFILKISIESCRTSVYRAIKSIKKSILFEGKNITAFYLLFVSIKKL